MPKHFNHFDPMFYARGVDSVKSFDAGDINLFGEVGYEIREDLVAAALVGRGDVAVNINSRGGDYYVGLAIYNMLKSHPGKVTTRVIGIAASAASVIQAAGDFREIASSARIMIHNSSVTVGGDKKYLSSVIEKIAAIDADMATIYTSISGLTPEKIAEMMDAETYLNSQEAVNLGFATAIMPEQTGAPEASAGLEILAALKNFSL
jgi:ATP-dependent Clp protease, protease subunit